MIDTLVIALFVKERCPTCSCDLWLIATVIAVTSSHRWVQSEVEVVQRLGS